MAAMVRPKTSREIEWPPLRIVQRTEVENLKGVRFDVLQEGGHPGLNAE